MDSAYSFWDVAPHKTSFTILFPRKIENWPDACCLRGAWTITKIEPMYLAEFRVDDPMLVIPEGRKAQIVAMATSKNNPTAYYLTRENLRRIIEWAEREKIQPYSITMPVKLNRPPKQLDATSATS